MDHVQETINALKESIANDERRIAEEKRSANELCRMLKLSLAYPQAEPIATRPDEYYGRPAEDVLRAILEKRKNGGLGAATIQEIHANMVDGGFDFETEEEHEVLTALEGQQFHKLPSGRYGLLEWYPRIKRRRPKEVAEESRDPISPKEPTT